MVFEQAVQYLYDLQPIGIKFGLQNTLTLLEHFHNPQQELKTIHIAGTNGKGSVCALLSSILQRAGYKVGVYTSPHLIDFTERITINGKPIEPAEVVRLTELLQKRIEQGGFYPSHPTFFEVVTVMALVYFAEQKVDIAVIEVGMGGRLDATNVIYPLMAIITSIDLDHQEYLGNTLVEIAGEKAGIIKEGISVVIGPCRPEVEEVFIEACRKHEAILVKSPDRTSVRLLHRDFSGQRIAQVPGFSPDQEFFLPFLGEHQIENALLGLTATTILSPLLPQPLSYVVISEGVAMARWPGRIQVYDGPPRVIIDGAHNPAAARRLGQFLKGAGYASLTLLLGIMHDKDIAGICRELVPLASKIILTRPQTSRAALPEEIFHLLQSQSMLGASSKVWTIDYLPRALQFALALTGSEDLLCLTGSLYTVGEAMVILDAR